VLLSPPRNPEAIAPSIRRLKPTPALALVFLSSSNALDARPGTHHDHRTFFPATPPLPYAGDGGYNPHNSLISLIPSQIIVLQDRFLGYLMSEREQINFFNQGLKLVIWYFWSILLFLALSLPKPSR